MTKISGSVPIKKAPEDTETRLAPRPGELHPWHGLRQEIDRLFDSFGLGWSRLPDFDPFRLPATPPAAAGFELSPQVDVSETDTAYEITAELPGLDKTDVSLTLSGDVITLKGEKKTEREEKKKGYHLSERRYGSFRRAFNLPDDVEVDRIKAEFTKGVMTVTLPKSASAKVKASEIPVKAA